MGAIPPFFMSETKREHTAPAERPKASERQDGHAAETADLPIDRSRDSFEAKHGGYLTALSKALGLDRNELVSLVARESRFDAKAKHSGGSSGLMQLTGVAFEDFKAGGRGRAAKYYPLLRKLDGILPPEAPKALVSLVAMASGKEAGSAAKWNRAVSQLRAAKFDPVGNLAVGSVLLAGMGDDMERRGEAPKERTKRQILAILNGLEHPNNLRKIMSAMRELGHV